MWSDPCLHKKSWSERLALDCVQPSLLWEETYARTNEGDLELIRPTVFFDDVLELRQRSSQVGCVGTVDVGLELREVHLDHLIVRSSLIWLKVVLESVGIVSNISCQEAVMRMCREYGCA